MMIKSATALRNDYDGMVQLSKSKQEPIFLTRNGEGEMVFLPIELWEKREAELKKLAESVNSTNGFLKNQIKDSSPTFKSFFNLQ